MDGDSNEKFLAIMQARTDALMDRRWMELAARRDELEHACWPPHDEIPIESDVLLVQTAARIALAEIYQRSSKRDK